jgi:signal transduction histidine kinase
LHGILESYPSLQPPHVDIQIVEPLPPVIANEAGLGQCFSNLLANAVKFVKLGITPKIRIWAEPRQDASEQSDNASIHQCGPAAAVRFWFEDNGIGVPREYQDRIFDMFQQLDKSYEGTGIGLALVRKTVERMKGKVGVECGSDKGSRFWLEFQRADPIIPQSNNRAAA